MEENVALAHHIARRMVSNKNIRRYQDREEILSDALMGLVKAASAWQSEKGVPFKSYASLKILGAIKDGLRKREREKNKKIVSLDVFLKFEQRED